MEKTPFTNPDVELAESPDEALSTIIFKLGRIKNPTEEQEQNLKQAFLEYERLTYDINRDMAMSYDPLEPHELEAATAESEDFERDLVVSA